MKKMRAIALLLGFCCMMTGFLSSCGSRAPKTEDIYTRAVELIEASYELNTVFHGKGLPVHKTDSEYAEFMHLYYNFSDKGVYEMVTRYAKFQSISDIKEAAEKVYSTKLLEEVFYPAAFTGYAISDGTGGSHYAYARFLEKEGQLYQYVEQGYDIQMRVYDYSTMKVIRPSNAKSCYISIVSWEPEHPEAASEETLRLVLQDDGEWYLDTFTD